MTDAENGVDFKALVQKRATNALLDKDWDGYAQLHAEHGRRMAPPTPKVLRTLFATWGKPEWELVRVLFECWPQLQVDLDEPMDRDCLWEERTLRWILFNTLDVNLLRGFYKQNYLTFGADDVAFVFTLRNQGVADITRDCMVPYGSRGTKPVLKLLRNHVDPAHLEALERDPSEIMMVEHMRKWQLEGRNALTVRHIVEQTKLGRLDLVKWMCTSKEAVVRDENRASEPVLTQRDRAVHAALAAIRENDSRAWRCAWRWIRASDAEGPGDAGLVKRASALLKYALWCGHRDPVRDLGPFLDIPHMDEAVFEKCLVSDDHLQFNAKHGKNKECLEFVQTIRDLRARSSRRTHARTDWDYTRVVHILPY